MMFTVITTSLLVVNGGGASTGIEILMTEYGVVGGVGAGRRFDIEKTPDPVFGNHRKCLKNAVRGLYIAL